MIIIIISILLIIIYTIFILLQKKKGFLSKIMIYFCLFIILFFSLYMYIGNYFFDVAMNPKSDKSYILEQDPYDDKQEEKDISKEWFNENKKEVTLDTKYGIMQGYEFVHNDTKKWLLGIHGFSSSAYNLSYFAKNVYDKGYNVLMIDLMGHGNSQGDVISFGSLDSYVINDWCDFLVKKYDADIAIFGVSMGAATLMNSLDKGVSDNENVKCYIEDCGYINLYDEFDYELKVLFNLPGYPLLNIMNPYFKYRAKFSLFDVDCYNNLKNNEKPFLIVQGDNDNFVPFENLDRIYQALIINEKNRKNIFKIVYKGAVHAQSMYLYKNEYFDSLDDFLRFYL